MGVGYWWVDRSSTHTHTHETHGCEPIWVTHTHAIHYSLAILPPLHTACPGPPAQQPPLPLSQTQSQSQTLSPPLSTRNLVPLPFPPLPFAFHLLAPQTMAPILTTIFQPKSSIYFVQTNPVSMELFV